MSMNYFWTFFLFGISATALLVLVTWLIAKAVTSHKTKQHKSDHKEHVTLKDRMRSALGAFGSVLWFIFSFAFQIAPAIILNWHFLIVFLIGIIPVVGPYLQCGIWIYALIVAVHGPQDVVAFIFYALFAIQFFTYFLPLIVGALSSLFNSGRYE